MDCSSSGSLRLSAFLQLDSFGLPSISGNHSSGDPGCELTFFIAASCSSSISSGVLRLRDELDVVMVPAIMYMKYEVQR